MDIPFFNVMIRSLPLLLKGSILSLQIFAITSICSLCLGSIMGALTCRQLRYRWLFMIIESVTFILRAVPIYVQLLIVYFVLPDLLKIQLEAFTAAVISLSLCSASYTSQIIRGGLNAIAKDQWETAYTLGYSTFDSLRLIIFPQLIKAILPSLTGELDSLLKSTSILASIGLLELTRMGMNVVSREMDPLPVYFAVAALYIGISAIFNFISKKLEKRFSYAHN